MEKAMSDDDIARYIADLEAMEAKIMRIGKRLEIDEIDSQQAAEMLLEVIVKPGEKIAERLSSMPKDLVRAFGLLLGLVSAQMITMWAEKNIDMTDRLMENITRLTALTIRTKKCFTNEED